jgi:hypothetical protein
MDVVRIDQLQRRDVGEVICWLSSVTPVDTGQVGEG